MAPPSEQSDTLLYGLYALDVDLTDSRLGPEWYSVRCKVEWEGAADDLRRLAAAHYEVPLVQVGAPRTWTSAS